MNRQELIQSRFSKQQDWCLSHILETTLDDKVISHVEYGLRNIVVNGMNVPMLMIAWVCCDAKYEGTGLTSSLIRTAHKITQDRADFAGLFSDIPRFYERLGYKNAPNLGEWGMVCPFSGAIWDSSAIVDLKGPLW